jgi:hypothetical protein
MKTDFLEHVRAIKMRYVRNKITQNDKVKDDEMGRACSTHVKRHANRVLVGKPEVRRLLEDLHGGGRIILK